MKMNMKMNKNICTIAVVIIISGIVCILVNRYQNEHFVEYSSSLDHSEYEPEVAKTLDNAATVGVQDAGVRVQDDGDVQEQFDNQPQAACALKEQLTPEELLPQDTGANAWSLSQPQGSGSLKDKNFLQAGHNIGINTVGQTLRNANMQLRSDPPNPQVAVSPWQQTTINPDTNRKPMEIGGCA